MTDNECPACKTEEAQNGGCPRCGSFGFPRDFWKNNYNELQRAILSHHIRKSVDNHERLEDNEDSHLKYSIEDFKNILKENLSLPKAKEQLNNLIMYLGANIASPSGSLIATSISLQAILGTLDKDGLDYVLSHAKEQGFVNILEPTSFDVIMETLRNGELGKQNNPLYCKLFLTFKG